MAAIHKWTVTEPYLQIDCSLGEAPFYDQGSHSVRFVDIKKQNLHVINLHQGPSSLQTHHLDVPVSITANIQDSDEEILVGAKGGYATLNRATGELRYIRKLWDEQDGDGKEKRMRLNDGAVDSRGRFWAGAMNDDNFKQPIDEGILFRLSPDLTLDRILMNVTVPNGIGWTKDNQTMYFTDSPTKDIIQFRYDEVTGDIADPHIFFHWDQEGVPDGFAIDVEGNLWVAICFGSRVVKISAQGQLVGEIFLPTRAITCPAFVGDELFITSMAEPEPEQHPESAKYGGSLFQVQVGIRGLALHKFPGHL